MHPASQDSVEITVSTYVCQNLKRFPLSSALSNVGGVCCHLQLLEAQIQDYIDHNKQLLLGGLPNMEHEGLNGMHAPFCVLQMETGLCSYFSLMIM